MNTALAPLAAPTPGERPAANADAPECSPLAVPATLLESVALMFTDHAQAHARKGDYFHARLCLLDCAALRYGAETLRTAAPEAEPDAAPDAAPNAPAPDATGDITGWRELQAEQDTHRHGRAVRLLVESAATHDANAQDAERGYPLIAAGYRADAAALLFAAETLNKLSREMERV